MASIIKSDHVRVQDRTTPGAAGPAASGGQRHEKTVELLRIEGRVQAIELVCTCGEKTLIELDYEQADKAEDASDA
jgi:hypothetical protein